MTNRERTAEARRRVAAATSRASERRERERAAPLLCEEAPGLLSLAVEVTESGQGPGVPDNTYTRRFALETAPALFLFACGEHLCEGGGHDISLQVMAGVASSAIPAPWGNDVPWHGGRSSLHAEDPFRADRDL